MNCVYGMLYSENYQRSVFTQKDLSSKRSTFKGNATMLIDFMIALLFVEFLLCARHYASYYENLSLILKSRSFNPHFRHNEIEAREIK